MMVGEIHIQSLLAPNPHCAKTEVVLLYWGSNLEDIYYLVTRRTCLSWSQKVNVLVQLKIYILAHDIAKLTKFERLTFTFYLSQVWYFQVVGSFPEQDTSRAY